MRHIENQDKIDVDKTIDVLSKHKSLKSLLLILLGRATNTKSFYRLLENTNLESLDVSQSFGLKNQSDTKRFLEYLSNNSTLKSIKIEGLIF